MPGFENCPDCGDDLISLIKYPRRDSGTKLLLLGVAFLVFGSYFPPFAIYQNLKKIVFLSGIILAFYGESLRVETSYFWECINCKHLFLRPKKFWNRPPPEQLQYECNKQVDPESGTGIVNTGVVNRKDSCLSCASELQPASKKHDAVFYFKWLYIYAGMLLVTLYLIPAIKFGNLFTALMGVIFFLSGCYWRAEKNYLWTCTECGDRFISHKESAEIIFDIFQVTIILIFACGLILVIGLSETGKEQFTNHTVPAFQYYRVVKISEIANILIQADRKKLDMPGKIARKYRTMLGRLKKRFPLEKFQEIGDTLLKLKALMQKKGISESTLDIGNGILNYTASPREQKNSLKLVFARWACKKKYGEIVTEKISEFMVK
ncbi:hypothetical protein ACFL35_20630 [Candidatus Riflebacteria bacterium]